MGLLGLNEDRALLPGANAGDTMESWADKITGQKDDAKAVFFMGMTSLLYAFTIQVLYFSLNRFTGIKAMRIAFWMTQVAYLPEGVLWLSSTFWDNTMIRQVYKISTSLALMAPFAGNWVGLIFMMLYAEQKNLWKTAGLWIGLFLWTAWTVFTMIIQVALSPKIMRWTDAPPGSDPDTTPVEATADAAVAEGGESAPITAGDEDVDSFGKFFDF